MRQILNILVIMTVWLLPAAALADDTAPKGTPDIEFAATTADLGTLHENDKPAKATFEFTNTGNAPLIIVTASASCGCTKPKFDPKPVMPGGKSTISVTFYPKGSRGEFDKTVTVRTNIKKKRRVVLHLTGVVIPDPK